MSLENAIQENTKALQSLAEIIKQALSMKPVQAPVAAAAPIQPVAAPAPEAKAAPVEPVAVADLPPVAAPAPAPKAEPKAQELVQRSTLSNCVRPWSPNCKSSSSILRPRVQRFSVLSASDASPNCRTKNCPLSAMHWLKLSKLKEF